MLYYVYSEKMENVLSKFKNKYKISLSMNNYSNKEQEGNQKSEGENNDKSNDNKGNMKKNDSFRKFLANQTVEDEKKQKRKRILINTIKYLSLNNISVNDYLSKKVFPSVPFELRGSEEFMDAVKFNNVDIIKQGLIRSKDYLNQYDYFKQTPLHWATKLGYSDMLKLFLKYTKMVNTYDKEYRTPIFLAALNNHKKCVEILLENGGNAFIKDKNGDLPEKVTTDENIRLLLQASNDKQFSELNEINKKRLKFLDNL